MKQTIGLFFFLSFALVSCSNEQLSKSEAAKAVKDAMKFPLPQSIDIPKNAKSAAGFSYMDKLNQMKSEKLLTYTISSSPIDPKTGKVMELLEVRLTELGNKCLIDTVATAAGSYYHVKAYELDLDAITNIKEVDANNAVVSYSLKYTNDTPFAKYISRKDQPDPGEASLVKQKNAWHTK